MSNKGFYYFLTFYIVIMAMLLYGILSGGF